MVYAVDQEGETEDVGEEDKFLRNVSIVFIIGFPSHHIPV